MRSGVRGVSKPDQIKSVTQAKHVFMGLYGFSGVGKTRLLGTLPDTLIIRPPIEHMNSIREPGNVEEWVVHSWSEMDEVLEAASGGAFDDYSFVWLDSASAFQDTGLDDIWSDVIAAKPHRKQYGLDKGEYGVNMTRFSQWMRAMVGLDRFNFGWTAHPFMGETMKDDGSTEELLLPYVQGKGMPLKFCGYMNLVAYYQVKKQDGKDVRVLRTNLTENYFAKDQFDAFQNGRLVAPTMPKILEKIEAARPKPKRASSKSTTRRRRTVKKGS